MEYLMLMLMLFFFKFTSVLIPVIMNLSYDIDFVLFSFLLK